MPIAALPEELRTSLIQLLTKLPNLNDGAVRRAYLHGAFQGMAAIPDIGTLAVADMLNTIAYFDQVGTLKGGRWPILMLLEHLTLFLPEGGELRSQVEQLRRRTEVYYATKSTPDVSSPLPDDGRELEAIIGDDDRLPYSFLVGALRAAKSVAILSIQPPGRSPASGTCWLLTPKHVITNWHVVACLVPGLDEARMKKNLEGAALRFDFVDSVQLGIPVAPLRWVAGSERLDFAVLELPAAPKDRDPLTVAPRSKLKGKRLNVVQHPFGQPISFALRDNDYAGSSGTDLIHYLSDTEPGASGSPVCDDAWNVVALHHAANRANVVVRDRHYEVHNEGIAMSAILAALPEGVRNQVLVAD